MKWGTLAPESLPSSRRVQDLGLARSVRYFNDSAVPGLGRMWYPMPLLWSVLAIAIATRLDRNALPIGNAIEARIMLDHLRSDAVQDRRVRGRQKLAGINDLSFRNLSRRSTYVTNPTRMSVVQPLTALGFVEGGRYGSFRLTDLGSRMLALPPMPECLKELESWVKGTKSEQKSLATSEQLSPLGRLPPSVCTLLEIQLFEGSEKNTTRRRHLRDLFQTPRLDLNIALESDTRLGPLTQDHWDDLRAGIALIDLRNLALKVLDDIETMLRREQDHGGPDHVSCKFAKQYAEGTLLHLQETARRTSLPRLTLSADLTSIEFAKQCAYLQPEDLLRYLAQLDDSVVCWRNGALKLGSGSSAKRQQGNGDNHTEESHDTLPQTTRINFPPQLFRLFNLHCLITELDGQPNPGVAARSPGEQA